jgi:hypothetical protein
MSDQLRLLVCRDCRSIEELPDYEGPVEHDVLLDHLVGTHQFPNGEPHKGNLMRVEKQWWELPSARKQIMEELGLTQGLGDEWYASKRTFEEDAMKCYKTHGRPKEGCIDYCDGNKRLGNPTKIGWQAGPKVFLCNFCPVQVYVDTDLAHKAGLYKEH